MKRFYLPFLVAILMIPSHLLSARSVQSADTLKVSFYYQVARYAIDSNFVRHQRMVAEMADTLQVDSARIYGWVSPEGGDAFNRKLSQDRAEALARLVHTQWPEAKILEVSGMGVDYGVEQKKENWPQMRRGDAYIWYHPLKRARRVPEKEVVLEPEPVVKPVIEPELEPLPDPIPVIKEPRLEEFEVAEYKPILAVGTNIPYLVCTAPNFDIEVPIGERWSVYGEHLFPWWVFNHNRSAIEVLHTDVGFRYWLGNRAFRPVLTGWYTGATAGAGYYDLEPDGEGKQGEFFGFSVEGGYNWALGRHWRLTLGAGVGPVWHKWRNYENRYDDEYLIWTSSKKGFWFGPTRARIGISYLFHTKKTHRETRYVND